MDMNMDRYDSSGAISSLASHYADDSASGSEEEHEHEEGEVNNISESDDESRMSTASQNMQKRQLTPDEDSLAKAPKLERKARSATRLVSYGPDEEQEEEHEISQITEQDVQAETSDTEIADNIIHTESPLKPLPESVRDSDSSDIRLPPEPPFKCSKKLQEKIRSFHDKMLRQGADLNSGIQKRKDFRNPSIYEKLITFCKIDEKGTNFPPEIYNPKIWGRESFYDELAKSQKIEMEKREKERKERTKVEFVTGTKKGGESSGGEQKRKSKWDSQAPSKPHVVTTSSTNPPVVSVTTSASGTKTTVISAIGTLVKKPK